MRNLIKIFSVITIFLFITAPYPVYAETPAPETTEENAEKPAEEVAPIPVEKVEEIEGAKEAKEEAKEKAKEKVAETDSEAVEDAVALWKAIEGQDWPLAAGFFVMILVYIFNRFGLKDKIGAKAIPYVSVAIGVLTAIGVALASGGSIASALEAGVLAGLAAIGSWETIFKKILGGSSESAEA